MARWLNLAIIPGVVVGICYFTISGLAELQFRNSLRKLSNSYHPMVNKVDDNAMCSGPRRVVPKSVVPYYRNAKYALHVGGVTTYGQTNNQIIIIFNALDVAMNSMNLTVVTVSGWAERLMREFIPDQESWDEISREFPIMKWGDHYLDPMIHTSKTLLERDHFSLKDHNRWEVTQSRRIRFLHYLFSSASGKTCNTLNQVTGYILGRFGAPEYIAVHVRNMEGACDRFNKWNIEQCEMEAGFIKSVLEPTGLYGKLPIVIVSDMQDEPKLRRLQSQLENAVIPQWDVNVKPSVFGDLAIGGNSELFIGNRGSSMSRNIGILREAFGKNVTSSYVFIEKGDDGTWKSVHPHHPYSWQMNDEAEEN